MHKNQSPPHSFAKWLMEYHHNNHAYLTREDIEQLKFEYALGVLINIEHDT